MRSERARRATEILVSDLVLYPVREALRSDSAFLYYMEGEYIPGGERVISRVPIDASAAPTPLFEGRPYGFELAGGYVYLSEPGTRDAIGNHAGDGQVMRMRLDGADLETIATPAGAPFGLAVDATHVYWLEADAANTGVGLYRARIDGSTYPLRLMSSDLYTQPESIALLQLAGNYVYWIADCLRSNGRQDQFMVRLAKP